MTDYSASSLCTEQPCIKERFLLEQVMSFKRKPSAAQMDPLVCRVAELLTAAVQEVLRVMGRAVSEYQDESARTRLENHNLQRQLQELRERTAGVPDQPHLLVNNDEEELIHHGESPASERPEHPESLLLRDENPVNLKLVSDEVDVDIQCHILQGTCDNLKKQKASSHLKSSPRRIPNPCPPNARAATSNPETPLNSSTSKIKVESKPEPLEYSVTDMTDSVISQAPALLLPDSSQLNEHNQQPVSNNVICYDQTYKTSDCTAVSSKLVLRSRIENTVDVHSAPGISARRDISHTCHVCGKTFATASSLRAHLVCHSNEKPFICKCCNFRFSRLADLKKHERIHTGERPYNCFLCGRRFNRTENLRRHLKKIHFGAVL